MYRACSTWQYEVVAHLLERHRGGFRLGYVVGEEYVAIDASARGQDRWRVLKSHEGHRKFARVLSKGQAQAVYTHRDLRDVVFSLMHKRGLRFEDLLRQGMIHQILANDRFWRRQQGILVQRYENLINDPVRGVVELATHLGIRLARGEAEQIARAYSFEANRDRMRRLGARLQAAGIDLEHLANAQFYDRETLLHWNHLRQGKVGSWRTEATPRQRSLLARIGNHWLSAHGYEAELAPRTSGSLTDAVFDRGTEARGALACTLRCLSLRYPRIARLVKRLLMIRTEAPLARPEIPSAQNRKHLPGSCPIPTLPSWRLETRLGSTELLQGKSA
jgi:hypothetical protein